MVALRTKRTRLGYVVWLVAGVVIAIPELWAVKDPDGVRSGTRGGPQPTQDATQPRRTPGGRLTARALAQEAEGASAVDFDDAEVSGWFAAATLLSLALPPTDGLNPP